MPWDPGIIRDKSRMPRFVSSRECSSGNCRIRAIFAIQLHGCGTCPRLLLRPKNIETIIASTATAKLRCVATPMASAAAIRARPGGGLNAARSSRSRPSARGSCRHALRWVSSLRFLIIGQTKSLRFRINRCGASVTLPSRRKHWQH